MSADSETPADTEPPDRASSARGGGVQLGAGARLVSFAVVAAVLASILVLFAPPDHDGRVLKAVARTRRHAPPVRLAAARARRGPAPMPLRQPQLAQATVAVSSRASTISVPDSFLGLSTEYWGLPLFERHASLFERVLSLLHVPGDGPLVLRVGGDSADRAFWDPVARSVPHWSFGLTPAWLRGTSRLVHRARVRLILDLNLVTGSPVRAAQWAGAAEADLPPGSIAGFEIGNEPDIYSRWSWRASMGRGAGFLPAYFSTSSYTQDFESYAHALAQVAATVPLIGPAVAAPARDVNWISGLLAGAHPGLGIVSAHSYPFSACVPRSSPIYPTIGRLLSERATAGVAQSVSTAVRLAHSAGLPFRLTELNSVTCSGRPGVSDTFATALWAPDALFELVRAGVDAVNVHVRAYAINAAFTLNDHGLGARPLLYGFILFARTLGPHARLVDLRLHASRSLHLKVWAVRVHGGFLHVLLIDKGNRTVNVHLRLPATGSALIERLLAPSASSRSGVTLGGQQLGTDGIWQGQPATETITPAADGYELTIPPASAALLTVQLQRGAPRLNTGRRPA